MNTELQETRSAVALATHSRIITNGKIVQTALYDMCSDLKTMRDEQLYTELGYEDFDAYAEQACGLGKRQAYSYIAAIEKLGADFVQKNAHLGITKLELISQISSYDRDEFLENNDVNSVSTRELKEQVNQYKNRIEQLTLELDSAQSENVKLTEDIEALETKISEEKPDVIVGSVLPDEKTIKAAVDEAVKKGKENEKNLKNKISSLKNDIKALEEERKKAIEAAKKQVSDEANAKIDKLIKDKQASDDKLQQALKAAKEANADEDLIAIRYKFSDLQATANEIKGHLAKLKLKDPQQADKLTAVMKTTLQSISEGL